MHASKSSIHVFTPCKFTPKCKVYASSKSCIPYMEYEEKNNLHAIWTRHIPAETQFYPVFV